MWSFSFTRWKELCKRQWWWFHNIMTVFTDHLKIIKMVHLLSMYFTTIKEFERRRKVPVALCYLQTNFPNAYTRPFLIFISNFPFQAHVPPLLPRHRNPTNCKHVRTHWGHSGSSGLCFCTHPRQRAYRYTPGSLPTLFFHLRYPCFFDSFHSFTGS